MRHSCKVSFLFVSVLALFVLFGVNRTMASEEVHWTEYESKTTNDLNKEWSITFSDKLDENSVNGENVYVQDSTGVIVKTNLHTYGNVVKISPEVSYEAGKSYTLYIGPNIQSTKNKILKTAVKFTFSVINEGTPSEFTADLITIDGRFGYVKLAINNPSNYKVKYFLASYSLLNLPHKGDKAPVEAIEYKTGDEFVLWRGHELFTYLVDENDRIIEMVKVNEQGYYPIDFQLTDHHTLLVKTTHLPESNETVADFMHYVYLTHGMKQVEKVTDFSAYKWKKIDGVYAIDIKFDNELDPSRVGRLNMRSKYIGVNGHPLGDAPYNREFLDLFMLRDWAGVENSSDHEMQFRIILERTIYRGGEDNIIENNAVSIRAYIDRIKANEYPLQTIQEVVDLVKQVNKELEEKIAPYKLAQELVNNLFKEGYQYLLPQEQLRDDLTKQDIEKAKAAVQLLDDEFKIEKEQLLKSTVFAEYYIEK